MNNPTAKTKKNQKNETEQIIWNLNMPNGRTRIESEAGE